MQGFLNLNKPPGLTSHDCVARVRKLLRMKRVGHGGTLDPAATGVLPIAVGRATRLLQYLSHQKVYRATIRFGLITETDDLEGAVISATPVPWLTLAYVEAALPPFIGAIQQVPPRYSAIQVGGKRLYDRARAGEQIEVPVRTVEIQRIQVLDWQSGDFPELEVMITCGTGTYIRSIARDLGAALGTGGTLAMLMRTASSGFQLADSLTLETLAAQIESAAFQPIPPEAVLLHHPAIELDATQAKQWSLGQRIPKELVSSAVQPECLVSSTSHAMYRIHHATTFLGMGEFVIRSGECWLAPRLVWQSGSGECS